MLVAHVIYWRNSVVNRIDYALNASPFTDFDLAGEPPEENRQHVLPDIARTCHLIHNASTILMRLIYKKLIQEKNTLNTN